MSKYGPQPKGDYDLSPAIARASNSGSVCPNMDRSRKAIMTRSQQRTIPISSLPSKYCQNTVKAGVRIFFSDDFVKSQKDAPCHIPRLFWRGGINAHHKRAACATFLYCSLKAIATGPVAPLFKSAACHIPRLFGHGRINAHQKRAGCATF